jgi:lysozyme
MSDPDDTLPGTPTKISDAGLTFIEQSEGCKLEAYQDSVGVWTIGVGHTKGVTAGQRITQDEADALLEADLEACYPCIAEHVTVPLTQGQFDALCSFVFNLGCGALKGSTLLNLLNKGDYDGAAQQFGRWVNAGGQKLAGLVTRRAGEAAMFSEVA